jgi:hypothetical protein
LFNNSYRLLIKLRM